MAAVSTACLYDGVLYRWLGQNGLHRLRVAYSLVGGKSIHCMILRSRVDTDSFE